MAHLEVVEDGLDLLGVLAWSRRREFCHSADALSPSLLEHLLEVEGGAAE